MIPQHLRRADMLICSFVCRPFSCVKDLTQTWTNQFRPAGLSNLGRWDWCQFFCFILYLDLFILNQLSFLLMRLIYSCIFYFILFFSPNILHLSNTEPTRQSNFEPC